MSPLDRLALRLSRPIRPSRRVSLSPFKNGMRKDEEIVGRGKAGTTALFSVGDAMLQGL
jgi:hypothetical protein